MCTPKQTIHCMHTRKLGHMFRIGIVCEPNVCPAKSPWARVSFRSHSIDAMQANYPYYQGHAVSNPNHKVLLAIQEISTGMFCSIFSCVLHRSRILQADATALSPWTLSVCMHLQNNSGCWARKCFGSLARWECTYRISAAVLPVLKTCRWCCTHALFDIIKCLIAEGKSLTALTQNRFLVISSTTSSIRAGMSRRATFRHSPFVGAVLSRGRPTMQ